jgi:hypothetical protein
MSDPLFISETNGLKRAVVLHGRSMPYKGAVLVEDEQRCEITFFPGNPVAYSQILGPQLTRTTFNGVWKDKFLKSLEHAPAVANFPALTAAGKPQGSLPQVTTGATFESSGSFPGTQDLRLAKTSGTPSGSCAGQVLTCRSSGPTGLASATWSASSAGPGPADEWEWECEFAWTGDTDVQPKVTYPKLDLKGFLDKLADLISGLNSLLLLPGLLINKVLGGFLSDVADILVQVSKFFKILDGISKFSFLPLAQLSALKALCFALRKQILDFFRKRRDGRKDGSLRLDTTGMWETELLVRKVRQILSLLAEELAFRIAEIEATAGEVLRVYTVEGVTSLQRISLEVYGTSGNWRQIALFNGKASQIVEAGTVLRIPKL